MIERLIPGIYLAVAVLVALLFARAAYLYAAGQIPLALGLLTVTAMCALAALTAWRAWCQWRDRHAR